MNTALVKPSKIIKGITSIVSAHLNAVERAREIYLAQMKCAEADYFERINRAVGVAHEDGPAETPEQAAQPAVEVNNAGNPA